MGNDHSSSRKPTDGFQSLATAWAATVLLSCGPASESTDAAAAGTESPAVNRSTSVPSEWGGRLAFLAHNGASWDVYTWDLESGSLPRPLTETLADERIVTISSDGHRVAWIDGSGAVKLWGEETSATQELTLDGVVGEFVDLEFGPGGRYLIGAWRKDKSQDDTDVRVLLVPDATEDSSGVPASEVLGELGFGPAWAPTASPHSWILPLQSSQFQPTVSEDGKTLAFSLLHSRWTPNVTVELWLAGMDSAWDRQLTLSGGVCAEAAWHPSGDKIALASNRSGSFDLWLMNVRERSWTQLTNSPEAEIQPVWSPNGDALIFAATEEGSAVLRHWDASTSHIVTLRPFGPDVHHPCSAPDWGGERTDKTNLQQTLDEDSSL